MRQMPGAKERVPAGVEWMCQSSIGRCDHRPRAAHPLRLSPLSVKTTTAITKAIPRNTRNTIPSELVMSESLCRRSHRREPRTPPSRQLPQPSPTPPWVQASQWTQSPSLRRVIFAMSQQNLARLSFCLFLRMRFADWTLCRSIPVVKARQGVKAIPAAVNHTLNGC